MLNKFFKFLRGYVIIDVCGKNSARFLNICIRRGIRVTHSIGIQNGIRLTLSARDFLLLRPIARKCRVRVRIKEKHSFKHTAHLYRYRIPFLIAIAVCIALGALMTRYIWLVEINGADERNIASITAVLDEIGVKSGALKSKLPEGQEMKRRIVEGADGVAWAWVYIEGAKARVEIYNSIIPPTVIDKSEPCDIVASTDGVIKKMNVKAGEEKVNIGDAVSAGDLLIAGTVSAYREGDSERYIMIHSLADIEAYTVHTAEGEYKLYYESRIPTGKKKRHSVLELFGKTFSLPFGEVKYEDYDRSEVRHELKLPFFGYTGIALNTVEVSEVTVSREPMPLETALDIAKNELEEKIAKELTIGAELTDEAFEYEQTDDETIKATLKMNFTENIAVQTPIGGVQDKGEEILDNKTDRGSAGN
ncbi:MAG: sporulation protein YqfD [Clostridia bacterium]|nr:sporulation protein YqfD [Clostridia bacterium]